ncbi:hypothetical protein NC651_004226 [Populus alba x Populus x berolinensis]|nr:hypothetical protein NC651_004226 [Populus alba x Populus x berolinensis]
MNCREFVETITRDLLGGCVFVISPSGENQFFIEIPMSSAGSRDFVLSFEVSEVAQDSSTNREWTRNNGW